MKVKSIIGIKSLQKSPNCNSVEEGVGAKKRSTVEERLPDVGE